MRRIPEFNPGFRISTLDGVVLVLGALGSALAGRAVGGMGLVIAFVVGHFFLFCNVFRVSRGLELIWAVVFVALASCNVVWGTPSWVVVIALSLAVTLAVVGVQLKKPSYHGVYWSRVNPKLRAWWESPEAKRQRNAE